MNALRLTLSCSIVAIAAFLALALPAAAQDTAAEYKPHVGQDGKDVIWVPTPHALIERMLDMAELKAGEIHYDLGSGDGRTVIAAAKRGAQATGVEYNPDMVKLSQRAAEKEGVAGKARFVQGDIFQTDFSKADVITLYLLPSLNLKLRPTILRMKPGTRVVSHAFTMDDWQPDRTETVEGRNAFLWIVPARVAGTWRWIGAGARQYELVLRQRFQVIEGGVRLGNGKLLQLRDAALRGDRIRFTLHEPDASGAAVRRAYEGTVSGGTIRGTVRHAGGEASWNATRAR